jgi:hypothetical protein
MHPANSSPSLCSYILLQMPSSNKKPPSGRTSAESMRSSSSSSLSSSLSWRRLESPETVRSGSANSMRSSPGLFRTRSSSSCGSVVSLRAPPYSPFTVVSSAASSPRRFTPQGRHVQPKYDPRSPSFRPISMITPVTSGVSTPNSSVAPLSFDNWPLSGFTTTPEVSRTGSAGSHPAVLRTSSADSKSGRNSGLSGRVSALSETLSRVDSAGALSRTPSFTDENFVATRTRSRDSALSRTSSAGSAVSSPRASRTGSAASASACEAYALAMS